MIELAIFDCDGVLVDTEDICHEAIGEVLAARGLHVSAAELQRRHLGRRIQDIVTMELPGLSPREHEEVVDAFYELLYLRIQEGLTVVSGAVETLAFCARQGIAVVVASNGPRRKLELCLEHSGMRSLVNRGAFCRDDVGGKAKPAPDLLLHAARSAGVTPDRCVAIDDSALGVEAARAAGMRALWLDVRHVYDAGPLVRCHADLRLALMGLGR